MSLFDFPRINFKGTIQLNPGTANNDDYANQNTLPASWGPPYAGQPLGLIDSKMVEARTYGMSDADFIAWAQQAHPFDVDGKPGQQQQIIPAEWNYYGSMTSKIVSAQVIGVQMAPSSFSDYDLLGASLTLSGGHITDVNSEGSPPATQFFIDGLTLTTKGGQTVLRGPVSKGACQWLNFYRNVNLTADGGAGGYVYHVLRDGPGVTINLAGFDDAYVIGVIFRYYLYHIHGNATDNPAIEAIYKKGGTNPATLEIAGTFAPLINDEKITTTPVGRLMVSNTAQIKTPSGTHNNGNGLVALAPAVLAITDNLVSIDAIGTFPDYYQAGANPPNPKFDFGPVSLVVTDGTRTATIGAIDYTDLATGDSLGWIFDFDIAKNPEAQQVLSNRREATFKLVSPTYGDVLVETDYFFVSNQQGIYAEQFGSGTEFLNQGTTEPATIAVYHRGRAVTGKWCPPVTLWQYRSIPLQAPGDAEALATDFGPGQPIEVDTSQPGNFLLTFTVDGTVPESYSTFMNPPYITNAPSISLRILPNNVDFSQYYQDPGAAEPVGNDLLTFQVVFDNVLHTYYLLYPAMNQVFQLNDEKAVAAQAQNILDATDPATWMTAGYMPRTRDLSASRRTLLQAWCRKVLAAGGSTT